MVSVESAPSAVVPRQRTRPLTNLTEIAIPIYNEERVLVESIHRLRTHLKTHFPYPFVITIADNGSTDASWELATQLANDLPEVQAIRVPIKGRGGAVRHAWSQSQADVVAYMDVDLSIDLDAFAPLVASVMSGHSDLAIGTRYAQGSFVDRSMKRAFFSRSYNYLLRNTLGARFSDAMCGFKAARREVIQELLPLVDDNKWFFDTEMLLFAQRRGLRIHEVPVVCIDDPDSSVHVIRDAIDDLRGMANVAGRLVGGVRAPRFAAIWALSAVLYGVLYVALRDDLPALGANLVALLVAGFANTAALRKFSFGVRGAAGAIRYQLGAWVDLIARFILTTAAIVLLQSGWQGVEPATEYAVVFGAVVLASSVRFLLLRGGTTDSEGGIELIRRDPAADRRTQVAKG